MREQRIPAELDRDGLDGQAIHVLIECEGVAAATGRVVVASDGEATAARIAVLPVHRGRGLGSRVVAELEELAVAAGATRLLLKPHSYLEAFYQRLGFVTLEGAETVAAHELIVMGKELRPPSDDRASRRRGRQKLEP